MGGFLGPLQALDPLLTANAALLADKLPANLPLAAYTRVKIPESSKETPLSFPNCVEASLENISNILSFDDTKLGADPHTPRFSIASLEKQLHKTASLPEDIKKFYKKYPGNYDQQAKLYLVYSADQLSKVDMQEDWLKIVLKNNIPYAMYSNLFKPGNSETGSPETIIKKFAIYLPPQSALIPSKTNKSGYYPQCIKVKDRLYDAFTDESGLLGYNLHSLTSNIIILLNHFLGLGLFGDANGLDQVISDKDFEGKYLPKLAEAIGGKIRSNYTNTDDLHTIVVTSIMPGANEKSGQEIKKQFVLRIDRGRHTEILGANPGGRLKKARRGNEKTGRKGQGKKVGDAGNLRKNTGLIY